MKCLNFLARQREFLLANSYHVIPTDALPLAELNLTTGETCFYVPTYFACFALLSHFFKVQFGIKLN